MTVLSSRVRSVPAGRAAGQDCDGFLCESRPLFGHCPPGRQATNKRHPAWPTDQRQGTTASRKQESDQNRAAPEIVLTVVAVTNRAHRLRDPGLAEPLLSNSAHTPL